MISYQELNQPLLSMHVIWHTVIHRQISHQYKNKDTPFQMEGFLMMLMKLKGSVGINRNLNKAELGYF